MRDAQLHAHSSDLKGSITPPASVGPAAASVVLALAAAAITVPADVGLVLAVVAEVVLFREVSARDGPLAIFALACKLAEAARRLCDAAREALERIFGLLDDARDFGAAVRALGIPGRVHLLLLARCLERGELRRLLREASGELRRLLRLQVCQLLGLLGQHPLEAEQEVKGCRLRGLESL